MAATAKTAVKPRLNNLNDLLMLNENTAHLAVNAAVGSKILSADTEYAIVAFALMDDYPDHPFRLYCGQRKDDMTESIRQKGILQPLILRSDAGGRYTVLAGHNRKYCGMDAGLDGGSAVIKHNLTDDEAYVYVIETNLMQRSFADMLPSEKAAVLASYHRKMFSQGKRNDILAEIQSLENTQDAGGQSTSAKFSRSFGAEKMLEENQTSGEFSRSFGTREALAEEYSLKTSQVALLLRSDQLIDPLKKRMNNLEFPLFVAAAMSFLTKEEQKSIDKCMERNNFKADVRKSGILRAYSADKNLNDENIYMILNGEIGSAPKKNRTPVVKVAKNIYTRYFKPEQSAKEVQETVEKALDYYFSHLQNKER
jgi:ParB family chromosome partitioning protein